MSRSQVALAGFGRSARAALFNYFIQRTSTQQFRWIALWGNLEVTADIYLTAGGYHHKVIIRGIFTQITPCAAKIVFLC